MPAINVTVSHTLEQEEALRRVQTLLNEVKKEHADKISDLVEEWSGNTGKFSFRAKGFKIKGILSVHGREIDLIGEIPLLAAPFSSLIKDTIRERAESLLA